MCGEILHDNTDYISYKGHILSDKQFFPLLDLADELIEDDSSDREALSMRFRRNIDEYIRFRCVYQCYNCGRLLVEGENGEFFFFAPEGHDNKSLFDIQTGEKA
ncbi:MAG: hypothetical protein J1F03_01485 [Oscillospiraceae bacterium]|nr:hypothetical protein [Oscillospiraceae bacterium]